MRKSDTSGLETVTRVGRDRLSTKPADSSTLIRLRKILWATDFSPFSEAALLYALAIARRYGAQIYLAHVIWEDAFQMVVPEAVASMLKEAERHVENQMARLLVSGRFRGISHQVLILRGEIWPALSAMIEKHEIDMLIIGTHGRTDMRKLLLGSVAEQIFRLASCPVLTVGPRASGKVPEETELRQILYATDFAPTSGFAAAYALSLAQEHQAHLTLLHVMQEGAHPSPEMAARMKESLTGQLRGLVPPEAALWCEPEATLEFGPPAEGILKAAQDRHADLIVLGVRRPGNLFGLLPPAIAYKVVCQAECPVLTVRG